MPARDVDHFDALAQLVRLEQSEERDRLAQQAKQLPLAEREKRGWVWLDLESTDEAVGLGGRILVTLSRADRRPLTSPLHVGDMVAVRPRKAELDAAPTAVVSKATRAQVQLAFERSPPPFVAEGRLRLDLVPNDATFQRTLGALEKWKSIERGKEFDRRERLLARSPPRFEREAEFLPSQPLNAEQLSAARRALAAQDFFLVHGPPGTGKSTVLAEVAFQAVSRGKRVLCTAASNAAVDHLLDLCLRRGLAALRVGHPARVAERLVQHTLDVLVEDHPDRKLSRDLFDQAYELMGYARRQRTQGRSRSRFANARASKAEARTLFDEARALERKAVRSLLDRARVVCATLASLDGGVLAGEAFDLVLVDEATQSTEPLALIGLLRAPVAILAGDHLQLPPTVLSQKAIERGLAVSLFERLLADCGDGVRTMLLEQYRMNARIMAFPSEQTYGGGLRVHPSVADRVLDLGLDTPALLFLDTAGKGFEEAHAEWDPSFFNEGEADLLSGWAERLVTAGLPPDELAAIAPYSAQVSLLRERAPLAGAEVDTVDAFQGREKDAVLLSLT
ncbi:MAG TPA: AAA domain-containing protein, partial [Myxococcaceae bacterium]|nr:AAA domain-containing protein [Myxococcaceae bacterium]